MPQNEIARMLPRHFKMLELAIEGYGAKEIAQALDCTPQSVSLVMRSPLFQSEIARRRDMREKVQDDVAASTVVEARAKLDSLAVEAVDVQGKLLNSEDDGVALRASDSILKRVLDTHDGVEGAVNLSVESLQILQLSVRESSDYREGEADE